MRNPSYPRSLGKYQAWYLASGKQWNCFEALNRGKPITGHMGKSSPDRGTGNAGLIRVHRESRAYQSSPGKRRTCHGVNEGWQLCSGLAECGRSATELRESRAYQSSLGKRRTCHGVKEWWRVCSGLAECGRPATGTGKVASPFRGGRSVARHRPVFRLIFILILILFLILFLFQHGVVVNFMPAIDHAPEVGQGIIPDG